MHRNALGYDASRPARGRVRVAQPESSLFKPFEPQRNGRHQQAWNQVPLDAPSPAHEYEHVPAPPVGDVRLFVISDGKKSTVLFTNVYFGASTLVRNIVSYGKIDARRYAISQLNGKCVVARRIDALAVFDVVIRNSVLVVRTVGMLAKTKELVDVIMAALHEELAADTSLVMHQGSLLHVH
ncbi:unnamed protein product [Peronospora belbahrii]|uniref:Uncharacterized protein n=1 Tax=Peronospora belbahrii TaxID=622444 RepID=A0AAU9KZ88_9STRA|nr:unnamed protein product [Peronospora belbahrii]